MRGLACEGRASVLLEGLAVAPQYEIDECPERVPGLGGWDGFEVSLGVGGISRPFLKLIV